MVAFGTYRRDLHPRVAVLVDGLTANGAHVTEINEPLPLDTADRVRMLQRPWLAPTLLLAIIRCWVRLWRRGRTDGTRPDAVLVGYMGHFDVHLARLCFPGVPVVLDHLLFAADTARDRGRAGRGLQALLQVLDSAALRGAGTVLVDTSEHARMVAERTRGHVVTVPVGATDEWYGVPAAQQHDGPLRVLFFGLFTPLQGTPVIAEAVHALPPHLDVVVTLVGRGQDHAAVLAMLGDDPRVRFRDWLEADELLRLAADSDVVLGIFGTSDKARRVVPTKVYQGLAAGRAVISSDTAPQRAALADSAVLVPPGDAAALARAIADLAADRAAARRLGERARAYAETRFTPAAVTAPVLEAIPRRGRRPAQLPPLSPLATLRWAVVRPRVTAMAPADVLEVGCGQGSLGARLARTEGIRYAGVEPDETSFAVARTRVGDAGLVHNCLDDSDLLPRGAWDVVCAFEVLEHLADDAAALQRWRALCRPGGHLVLSVPAWQRRMGPWDRMVGHYRRYEPDRLRALLASNGWVVQEVTLYAPLIGRVMEVVRNRVASRRTAEDVGRAPEELTQSSGRLLQPRGLVGRAVAVGMAPWVLLQHAAPNGNAIVAVARRPD